MRTRGYLVMQGYREDPERTRECIDAAGWMHSGDLATIDRIAHYKVPRYVRFVDEFPMTATGKAQKFAMRGQMMRELGLAEARSA